MRAWAVALLLAVLLSSCGGGDHAPDATSTAPVAVASSATPLPTATPDTATATPPVVSAATPAPPVAGPTLVLRASPPDPNSITISAVGDISLAREVVDRMEREGASYPYALIAPALNGDIVAGNLEGALTDRGEPWPKGYNFRTPPRFAPGLRDAGFDIVSLANNHTLDYGAIGLTDTFAALDAAGVRYAGAGTDDTAARAPVIMEAKGQRVAFLAYAATPDEGGGFSIEQWRAAPGAPGLAVGDPATIAADVASARMQADFVVVLVHAGSEYITTPNAAQRALADAALAAGADAYIGAHAHVVQPVERRGGQLIAWGLGNFIFDLDEVDLANIPQPRVTLVLNITLTKGAGVTAWDAIPLVQDAAEDRPRPATTEEAAVLQSLLAP